MKKLNRKGFTLVELLAVIVILAIVVGIAVPYVQNVVNTSKRKGFETQLESSAAYLKKQAQLMNVDSSSLDDEFKNTIYTSIGSMHMLKVDGSDYAEEYVKPLIKKMGLKLENVSEVWICITEDGKSTVQVNAIPLNSEYYTPGHWIEDSPGRYVTADVNTWVGDAEVYFNEAHGYTYECR